MARRWPKPPVTEPEWGVLYAPSDLGLPFPECRGVQVGRCIRGWTWEDEAAHAHVTDPNAGVICVKKDWLLWQSGSWEPRDLMWHEYAHILAGPDALGEDHAPDGVWAAIMLGWGRRPSRVA